MNAILEPQDGDMAAAPGLGVLSSDEVERIECDHIAAWRRHAGIAAHAVRSGLAFSGGGIRSATFGLGVLEGLRDLKLLPRFDYYSSVSGGGYIMAWLRAHCHRDGPGWLDGDEQTIERWDRSVSHLSKFSNYLSPRVGLFSADTWTMFTVWARNALLVQLTIVCFIVLALLMPRLAIFWFASWPEVPTVRGLITALFVLATVLIAANQWCQRRRALKKGRMRPVWWRVLGPLAVAGFTAATVLWVASGFAPFAKMPPPPPTWPALPVAMLLMASAMCLSPVIVRCNGFRNGRDWPDFGQAQVQWLIVMPLLLASIELSGVLWQLASLPPTSFGEMFMQGVMRWPLQLALAFAGLGLLACCSLKRWDGCKWRLPIPRAAFNVVLIGITSAACMVALHAMFVGIVLLMQSFTGPGARWHAFIWGPTLLLAAFAGAVTLLIGLLGNASLEGIREWWSRLAAWLFIYAIGWTVLTVAALYGPMLIPWMLQVDDWKAAAAAAGWAGTVLGGLLAARSSATNGGDKVCSRETTRWQQSLEVLAVLAPPLFIAGLLVITATVLNAALAHAVLVHPGRWFALANCGANACCLDYWTQMDAVPPMILVLTLGGTAVIAALLAWRVDINEFSLHAFYRSRLVRCYLGASAPVRDPQKFTQFDDDDDLAATVSRGPDSGRREMPDAPVDGDKEQPPAGAALPTSPLHLINCTVNLGGSRDLSLHTRHGASFTITPYTIGSNYPERAGGPGNGDDWIGYRRHEFYTMVGLDGLTLGETMAVSGGAASPNMGFHTSPAVAFMMTMFNVRLGRWLANPSRDAARRSPGCSAAYLIRELFGSADEQSSYLMISDGGHFENLGAYELVRRRCKLIVIVDAESDPHMRFGALGTLIRLCHIDFGARIELDVQKIALQASGSGAGLSARHHAVGTIVYQKTSRHASEERGVVLYLKASLTDSVQDASLRQYHATHAAFPHESTGDQFYGEDQFESYRRLGRHIVKEAFADPDFKMRVELSRPDFVLP
jgi:hypothetical protein